MDNSLIAVSRPPFKEVIVNNQTPRKIRHSRRSMADGVTIVPCGPSDGIDSVGASQAGDAHVRLPIRAIGQRLVGLLLCTSSFVACGEGNTPNTLSGNAPAATSTSVQVSVAARDSDGHQLHYRWAATEGTINNTDTSTTTWTVPTGSGEQFAYVLVSDEKGGYAESRAVALTFDTVAQHTPTEISPPPDSGKAFIWGTLFYEGFGRQVYLPDWDVQVSGPGGTFSSKTDVKGEFFFSGLSPASTYSFRYKIPGQNAFISGQDIPTTPLPTSPSAPTYSRQRVTLSGTLQIGGSVRMADDSYCGVRDEFFVKPSDSKMLSTPISASAELLDSTNAPVGTPNPRPRAIVNHYGDYLIVLNQVTSAPVGPKVRITCETLTEDQPYTNGFSGQQKGPSFRLSNHRPTIQSMTVTRGGQDVTRPDFPKATTLLPEMELAPGDDAFLTYKGIDTRKGACAYYHKIGAVQGCDPVDGFPTGSQLTLDEWQKRFNLSPYHDGNPEEPELKAIYINKSDLNLARDMQGIKRKDGTLAFNVCNYPGPQDVNDPLGTPKPIGKETEPDINLAIENTRRGIGRIVCVAMDYSVTPGLNDGKPFVKFYTFSPSGKLLLSVSLDGRREKFMPGVCVGCHGGDNYGGKFPDDYSSTSPANSTGSGQANLGSFFLPFDIANLNYSTSDPARTRQALLKPLRQMNELFASFTPATPTDPTRPLTNDVRTLITTRWYPSANTNNEQTFPSTSNYELFEEGKLNVLGQQVLGQQIDGNGVLPGKSCTSCHDAKTASPFGPHDSTAKYVTVIAPSCLICHSSNAGVSDVQAGDIRPQLPFGGTPPRITFILRPPSHYLVTASRGSHPVCGGSQDLKANHMMPNSLSSFERFWQEGSPQSAALFAFAPPKNGPQPGACADIAPHPDL